MINLFNIENYEINTANFDNLLHGNIVSEFENNFKNYVGASYACSVNSATNAIFLSFLGKGITVNLPSIIPPVVANALITSGNKIKFIDNIEWVGHSYILHEFDEYKIVDSAQKVEKDQFKKECNPEDLMIFSFYPTKPVGSVDGGIIVSNDSKKIEWFKEATLNGMSFSKDNWNRRIKFPGYKMYMNSIQSFIANENLKKISFKKERLYEIREFYNSQLQYKNSSDHLFRIQVRNNDKFIRNMRERNIMCGKHYSALHLNPVYRDCESSKDLILSKNISKRTVSIPFHEKLTKKDLSYIVRCCNICRDE